MNKFVERITQYRKEKGFTQQQMAEKLGIAQVNYGKIETGKTELTLDRLIKISNILEVNMVTLLWPDYKEVQFTQGLQDENLRLKKLNDILIKSVEDKQRLIEITMQFYPQVKTFLETLLLHDKVKDLDIKALEEL